MDQFLERPQVRFGTRNASNGQGRRECASSGRVCDVGGDVSTPVLTGDWISWEESAARQGKRNVVSMQQKGSSPVFSADLFCPAASALVQ